MAEYSRSGSAQGARALFDFAPAVAGGGGDEDGRLIERTTTYQLKKTDEVGKKWGQQ